jgi:hypothetical protein
MGESLLVRKAGGGAKIEEAVQNFNVASGQTILPGTFVSFVDNILNQNGLTFQSNLSDDINIVKLSDTKVVVVFRHQSDNNTPKAFVVDINGNTMTAGTFYTIVAGDAYNVAATRLDNTRFAVTYWKTSQGAIRIGSVSGTVITFGTATNYEGNSIGHPVALDGTRVFIAYRNQNNSNIMYSRVVTISGTNITSTGTAYAFTQTSNNTTVGNFPRTELIEPNKVIIAYKNQVSVTGGGAGAGRSYAIVASISSNTLVSHSNNLPIDDEFEVDTVVPVVLTPSKIAFVTYHTSSGFSGAGKVAIGKFNTGLSTLYIRYGGRITTKSHGTFQSGFRLNDNELLIITGDGFADQGGSGITRHTVSLTVVSAYETGIIEGLYSTEYVDVAVRNKMYITLSGSLTTSLMAGVLLENNKVMIGYRHQSSGAGNLVIANLNKLITNTTAANPSKIFGLAKTGGTAGQTIEVFVNE